MNTSLRWKLILAFVLVFLAGLACGFFVAASGVHLMMSHGHRVSLADHMKRRLQAELKLTPEQVQQISPALDRAASQLQAKREQTATDVRRIFEQLHRDIAAFLTPDQRTRLQKIEEHHRRLNPHHHPAPLPPPPGEEH